LLRAQRPQTRKYSGHGDVHVVIRFSREVSRYIEESRWHASQPIAKQKDGSLIAEFNLNGTEEVKHWLMSFGTHAIVLEPASLRQAVIQESCTL
jgi:proteasome accessory factor B